MIANRILFAHLRPFAQLVPGLEARGLQVETFTNAALAQPGKVLGCFVGFYEAMRHPYDVWRIRQACSRAGVPVVTWNRDAPHYLNRSAWRLDLLDRFRLFDIYASHTLIDTRRSFADATAYLPNAADVGRYNAGKDPTALLRKLRNESSYRWDVSFLGGMNGTRYKEDKARQDFFAALAPRLDERKIRYSFREAEGTSVTEQVAFFHASKINLNFGARCEYLAPVASGLPERCYGIPACGSLLLCDKRTHAVDDFTPGENWAEFDGLDDCVAQIECHLANFAVARDLAARCYAHVMARHTYAHRAATLHDVMLDWQEGRRGRLI